MSHGHSMKGCVCEQCAKARARAIAWVREHPGKRQSYLAATTNERRQAFRTWEQQNKEKRDADHKRRDMANPVQTKARIKRSRRLRRNRIFNTAGWHTEAEFVELCKTFDWLCAYCGCDIYGCATEDHAIPLSRGGTDSIDNILPACQKCNGAKYTKTPLEYLLSRTPSYPPRTGPIAPYNRF